MSDGEPARISPSLLAGLKESAAVDWNPSRRLLLGIGPPFEPLPWDPCYDDPDNMEEEAFFVKASQELTFDEGTLTATATVSGATMSGSSTAITATATPGPSRWGRKQTSNDIHALRMAGIPNKTQNQSCW